MVTLVDRKTGLCLVRKVKTRHAEGVAAATIAALKPMKSLVRTVTFDQGLKFAQHEKKLQQWALMFFSQIHTSFGNEAPTNTETAYCVRATPNKAVALASCLASYQYLRRH